MKKENNMPLEIEELSKMNAFECLWYCSEEHLDDIALTYCADQNVKNLNSNPPITKITYRQLIKNIIKTYNTLKENGVKKYDIIAYSSISTPEMIYTAYASIMLGSIFKPIDVRLNSQELLKQFEQTPSKIFFASEPFIKEVLPIYSDIGVDKIVVMNYQESLNKVIKLASKLQKLKSQDKKYFIPDKKIFTTWSKFIIPGENIIPRQFTTSKDAIHLTATTGTTGAPKQLLHSSENWNAQLYNASHCGLDFKRKDTFFNVTVPWVDFGFVNAIHTFLCNGITINMDPLWSAENNADFIIKNNPNWWMGAPGWLDQLFTNDQYQNSSLSNAKYYITGGAPLYPHKHELYQDKLTKMSNGKGQIVPGYGYSEATAALTTDLENKIYTIGKMWPLVRYEVRDYETGEVLPKNTAGELWVTSKDKRLSQISLGYLNNSEENARIFKVDEDGNKWSRSGDKVIENYDGTFTYIERYKNILTYNGFNINCDKISEKVLELSEITNVLVLGCITEDGNQMPIICVEIDNNKSIDFKEIEKKIFNLIKNSFPDYYTPKDVVIYEKFPTISMKIDRQKIKKELLNENGTYTKKLKK